MRLLVSGGVPAGNAAMAVHGDSLAEHIKGMRRAGWGAVPAGRRSSRRRPHINESKLVTGVIAGYGRAGDPGSAVRSGRVSGRRRAPTVRMIFVVAGEVVAGGVTASPPA